jgi:hypothetical protein
MDNTYFNDIVYFNNLSKKDRVKFITRRLENNGLKTNVQPFSSCFGEGINILVEFGCEFEKTTVISAHYDGESYFDNTGGVISLLSLSTLLKKENKLDGSIVLLFTDQEETYQQGAAYFLKENYKYSIVKNINIDGFGIGEKLFSYGELVNSSTPFKNDFLLCDSDEFIKFGIPSITYFSAFTYDFINAKKYCDIKLYFNKYNDKSFFLKGSENSNTHTLIYSLKEKILNQYEHGTFKHYCK